MLSDKDNEMSNGEENDNEMSNGEENDDNNDTNKCR